VLGWEVRILLGPNAVLPIEDRVDVVRFTSAQSLQDVLGQHLAWCNCLVMAAAVADYRPKACEVDCSGKRRRTGEDLSIALESTPDLLSGCSKNARTDQLLVGFALEPAAEMVASANRKLAKKDIDLIVANPLETMDADTIEAQLIGNRDRGINFEQHTDGSISKDAFASWLLGHLDALVAERLNSANTTTESTSHVEL